MLAVLSGAASAWGITIALKNLDCSGNIGQFHIHVSWLAIRKHSSHTALCLAHTTATQFGYSTLGTEAFPQGNGELAAVSSHVSICHKQSIKWSLQPVPMPHTLIILITGPRWVPWDECLLAGQDTAGSVGVQAEKPKAFPWSWLDATRGSWRHLESHKDQGFKDVLQMG